MKNENLNIDKYFEIARSAPIVITKDEVMKIIGSMPCAPPISFGQTIVKFKNVIIMTTTTIATIVTAFIYFGNNSASIIEPLDPQTSNNEIILIDDNEDEDSLRVENLAINQDSNKVLSGSVIEYNQIVLNGDPDEDILSDSLISEDNLEPTNFIIPDLTETNNAPDSTILTEVYSKSAVDDTIRYTKNTEIRKFNSEYDYKDGSTVNVSNRYGEIEIKTWDKNKVKVEVNVMVKSSDEKNINEFFNNFDITPEYEGNDLIIRQPVVAQNRFGIIFIPIRRTKFRNGKKIKGIRKLSVDYTVTVPMSCNLLVKNKYNDIHIGDFAGKLSVNLYDADLKAGNIQGDFDLILKYGNAKVKSTNNSTIEIYESDIDLLAADKVKIESKYSDIKFNKVNTLSINSYEDEIVIMGDMNKFRGKLRYGDVSLMNINECDLDLYETDITGGVFDKFKYEGKYTSIEIQGADSMDIFSTYEDKFKITEAGAIFGMGKYAEFEIRKLTKSMKFNNYEGFINVFSAGNNPLDLNFKSKYTDYNIVLNSKLSYNFDVKCKYGDFDFPKEKFEKTIHVSDDDELKLQGVFNKTSDAAKSKVSFDCYEADVNISLR